MKTLTLVGAFVAHLTHVVQGSESAMSRDAEKAVASCVAGVHPAQPIAFDRSASTLDGRGQLRSRRRARQLATALDSATVVDRSVLACVAHAGCTFGAFQTYVSMSRPRAVNDSTVMIHVLMMFRTSGGRLQHSRTEQDYCVTRDRVRQCGRRVQT